MGCGNCGGCSTSSGTPAGCGNKGHCQTGGCNKLNTYDWLADICFLDERHVPDIVEVRFKGTRKGFYRNRPELDLHIGDPVIVDSATGGYDLGFVSLTGELVPLQMKKYGVEADQKNMLSIQRWAEEGDLARWEALKSQEHQVMVDARQHAEQLGLVMKISDVEYQGDGAKAIFYYTADGRVDFRELIKVLARNFKTKIEMRQIGLRQEAGRLGGIGSCGRELCCSTWLTDFSSVPTTAARYQNLFLNPLKLSGQCGRLKCCLNYELDTYLEALVDFPKDSTVIKTKKGKATAIKSDILTRVMWFSLKSEDGGTAPRTYRLAVEDVNYLLELNRQGSWPEDLEDFSMEDEDETEEEVGFKDVIGESKLDRFDKRQRPARKKTKRGGAGRARTQTNAAAAPSKPSGSREKKAKDEAAAPKNQKPASKEAKSRSKGSSKPSDKKSRSGGGPKQDTSSPQPGSGEAGAKGKPAPKNQSSERKPEDDTPTKPKTGRRKKRPPRGNSPSKGDGSNPPRSSS